MKREERFVLSHRPYAVDLSSLRVEVSEPWGAMTETHYWGYIDAVWFRRRKGVTIACTGQLRDHQDVRPANGQEFVEHATDGRYGGDCAGRWDGERYWGAQEPEVIEQHLALLRPMLGNYPQIPDGWDGWWTFPKEADR
ncbi:hypothetical protein NONO_c60260 [Nocardia nova SH22a]|uniref:Uncharacterized protein n=1 Tax=Nocardia nova SH22a TaxID=1415166 RepID=W5TNH0_9NOCA|nr:hypothetical protein [Nocardia nova]AHH20802.1 hypothetical protein NONO_c60260 [Nocardia nova SH22a]